MKRLTKLLHKGEKGFTLLELMVVIAILGVLAAVVVPDFGSFFGSGQTEACEIEERMVKTAVIAYASDTGECPDDEEDLGDYFEGGADALQGDYTLSGTYPNCAVVQDECPDSETSGGEPEPEPKPKPKPEPNPWGPFNPWGSW